MARNKKKGAGSSTTVVKTLAKYIPRKTHEPRPVGHNGKNWIPVKTHSAPNRNTSYQALPPLPAGPLHMDLATVIPPAQMSVIQKAGKLVFHLTGDVGGIMDPNPQQIVADHMEADITNSQDDSKPAFMYIVGDVVYFDGQSPQYFPQFYQPYEHCPAPIFAIPGNHDGEVDPDVPAGTRSLDAFMENFCASKPVITPSAGESRREAMTQPYCYWTLDTPFATLVGIYTNVPEGGEVDAAQTAWLVNELQTASKSKALIFSLHHPLYSLDQFHAGSQKMLTLVQSAFNQAKRVPDIIFAGHVHNYQRFTWTMNGRQVPQCVVGNCGYHNLHAMAKDPNGSKPSEPETISPTLTLESYVDDRHGFLRLEVDTSTITGRLYSVPKPSEDRNGAANLEDKFVLNYKTG